MCMVFKGCDFGEKYLFAGEMIVLLLDVCMKIC